MMLISAAVAVALLITGAVYSAEWSGRSPMSFKQGG
jgi:hypothetical protein